MTTGTSGHQLQEFKHVHQNEPDIRRWWFSDESYDLILWYKLDGELTGFQICYGPEHSERAITYSDGHFSHRAIIDEIRSRATPILNGTVRFEDKKLVEDFLSHAGTLEKDVYSYIEKVPKEKLVSAS